MPGKVNPVIAESVDDGLRSGDRQRCHGHSGRTGGQLRADRDAPGDGLQPVAIHRAARDRCQTTSRLKCIEGIKANEAALQEPD